MEQHKRIRISWQVVRSVYLIIQLNKEIAIVIFTWYCYLYLTVPVINDNASYKWQCQLLAAVTIISSNYQLWVKIASYKSQLTVISDNC